MIKEDTKIEVVEFSREILPQILDLFDKEINEEGKIIDRITGNVLHDPLTGVELNKDNFAGILPGSNLFISKNATSLADYIIKKQEVSKKDE